MQPIDLYRFIETKLEQYTKLLDIDDSDKYYELSDYQKDSVFSVYDKGSINRVFAQMAFHAQNGTMISKVINFNIHFNVLQEITSDFNPLVFFSKYEKQVYDLKQTLVTNLGIKQNEDNALILRYSNTLIACARYLKRFKNRECVLRDLKNHYVSNDFENLINYLLGDNGVGTGNGLGIPLICDFLKEFDTFFNGIAKPDVHIKDFLASYYDNFESKYSNENHFSCIQRMRELVDSINKQLAIKEKITVYKFDRMIYLLCSCGFYLDKKKSVKESFLKTIKNK